MTWNDCPLCSNALEQRNESSLVCEKNDHYFVFCGYDSNFGSTYSETVYIGRYIMYRGTLTCNKFEVYSVSNKYIASLDLILSPKITQEYMERLILFS